MGHNIQVVVGRDGAIARFQADWPGSRAVELIEGWRAIPVDDALHEAITARFPDAEMPEELDLAPRGIGEALAAATARGGGLAYAETDYFGGSGAQSAMAYVDGRQASAPERSKGAGGPINSALRAIGVTRSQMDDEFDTIGLGYRRSMRDYEPDGPVRLRGEKALPAGVTKEPTLPVWVVVVIIAACVSLGAAMAMMH